MAESSSEAGAIKRSAPSSSDDLGQDGPPEEKAQKVETEELKAPPKQYKEIRKVLRSITNQASKSEKDTTRLLTLLAQLKDLCSVATSEEGELPPGAMVIQMHLKNAFFNSEGIKDGDNIKTFLNGLEDGSEGKSDKDGSVCVFYANLATALWYRWDETNQQWHWTPEADFLLWMPCSTTTVTDGEWKGETPAPENVEIIQYLDAVRPVPREEAYLAEQYNVVTLLTDLAAVEGLKEAVAAIAVALRDQEMATEDQAGYVKALRDAMTKLLETEEQSK